MSDRFFDITPDKWFFNDVLELDSLLDNNDRPFISGIPFNNFVSGHEAVDELITVSSPTNLIEVNYILTHTAYTPVKVYIDGVNTIFDDIKVNTPSTGKSQIKLKRSVSPSSIIRVVQQGIPETDPATGNRPIPINANYKYPQLQLPIDTTNGYVYSYNPFSSIGFESVNYNGSQLKRRDYMTGMESNYNFFITPYEYTIKPSVNGSSGGLLLVPFQLDNANLSINYLVKHSVTGIESQLTYSGKNVIAKRLFIEGSNPLTKYNRMYFGVFPDVDIYRAEFFTFLNNLRKHMWRMFSVTDPYTSTKTESRFPDVNAVLGSNPWWWSAVRDLEDLKLSDGSSLIEGYPDGNLYINNTLSRAQAVALVNRFRIWFIDAFK